MKRTEDAAATYAAQWAEYRRRRRAAVAVYLGGMPAAVAAKWALSRAGLPGVAEYAFAAVALVWVIAVIATSRGWGRWPCPRCGSPFAPRARWIVGRRGCVRCGLPWWAGSIGEHRA